MKVAITGSNGYIGQYVQAVLNKDSDISTTLLTIDNPDYPYVKINYTIEELIKVFKDIDTVVHLAAIKNVKTYNEMDENIKLTELIAEAVAKSACKKLIYASSISVYSEEEKIPWIEGQAERPVSLYGLSKLAGEHIIRISAKDNGYQYTNLRFAHVIGDNMPGTYMIPSFFRNVENGLSITVRGKSVAKRELIDVVDVARAINWAIIDDRSNNQTINIGSGIGLTNLEIALSMTKNKRESIIYEEDKDEKIKSSIMNIEKAKRLGFQANCSPQEAIERILKDKGKTIAEIVK